MPLFLDLAEHAEFPRERRVVGDWVCCHPPLCAPPWHLFPVIGATAMSNSPAPQSFWDDEVTPRPTPRPDWICHGLLARGVTTLLSGHRKLTRKTTLLCCWPLWKTGVQRTRCMTCSRSRTTRRSAFHQRRACWSGSMSTADGEDLCDVPQSGPQGNAGGVPMSGSTEFRPGQLHPVVRRLYCARIDSRRLFSPLSEAARCRRHAGTASFGPSN